MSRRTRKQPNLTSRRRFLGTAAALLGGTALPGLRAAELSALESAHRSGELPADIDPARAAAARRWLRSEFTPSTLDPDAQMAEMQFFIRAAAPFRGQRIHVVSETIPTHVYEQRILARAFHEITGIRVQHDLIHEGELVERIQRQTRTGRNLYDAYVNDSDFIGTHFRGDAVVPLSDWMAAEGAEVTLPTLDLDDFIGLSFTTGPDGVLYQLPDQQFANLYWFRDDWFRRDDLRRGFETRYGYPLGVPLNWKAYEDIADYFTNQVREIDGRRVYGHMDYGKADPSLGWRFTDAWLAMAGVGDPGLPNGTPVDEWGIRVEECRPVGSTVSRGGATNSPAAVYALRKYLEWLRAFAPPEALDMTFTDAGPVPARGDIAQQVFWYSAFTPDLVKPGSAVMDSDGLPKWRVAPSPHGSYWEPGMKLGYQDCGAWTLPATTPLDRRRAAWLYAQFCVCKTVSLKKTLVGLTPIRRSDLASEAMTAAAPRLGGLVEFYRSPSHLAWTPTGLNVPDYPKLAQLWWTRIADAVRGKTDPQQTLDNLAEAQDQTLARIAALGLSKRCAPQVSAPEDPAVWLGRPGAPKPRLPDEEGIGKTMDYETLKEAWRTGRFGV
ncbi:ABC transporter substrate-binding protein [Thiocapsa marina]|uniref:Sugar ABC transporter periplasmic protein n=1 Tax=Thiocapsa marina 5811 TaxID=768671 RepID=F9U6R6_9GAMM|nr:ABC transporter substrate-binding protein [Thiocapsa marina]EGV19942.1 sugar ABC transporter periplasmic protein [Thiocapsa marina 5811]